MVFLWIFFQSCLVAVRQNEMQFSVGHSSLVILSGALTIHSLHSLCNTEEEVSY